MSPHPATLPPVRSRDDLARYALALHAAVQPYYSPGRARVSLGPYVGDYDRVAAELEGFARPLWGLAPLLAGDYTVPFWDEVLVGLANGVDPEHPEYWGDVADFDQKIVESAALSFTLLIAREASWGRLPEAARGNLVRWLGQVASVQTSPNNWRFFQVLAHLALRSVGEATDDARLEALLDFIRSCASGEDGWFTDGRRPQADHYVGFAMQFYGLLFARYAPPELAAHAGYFRDQARRFAPQFREWFADDGAAVPMGRSLLYRFAHAAFWGAAAFTGDTELSPGELKRLTLGNIRWWQATDMLDRDGVLSIGGAYPNPVVAEFYCSAQGPYWAFKSFLPLALPADHPFWAEEEREPASEPAARRQPVPGMLLQRQPGDVTALSGGQEAADRFLHTAEKYGKFAYSTRYGFGVERDGRNFETGAFDSMLAVSTDGVHFGMRKHSLDARILGEMLYSRWQALPGVEVETATFPVGLGHVRLHRIVTTQTIQLAEGGFALPMPDRSSVTQAQGERWLALRSATDASAIHVLAAPAPVTLQRVVAAPGSHFLFPRSVVPQLRLRLEPGTHLLAAWFGASPDKPAVDAALAAPPELPEPEALFARLRSEGEPAVPWRDQVAAAVAYLKQRDAALNGLGTGR